MRAPRAQRKAVREIKWRAECRACSYTDRARDALYDLGLMEGDVADAVSRGRLAAWMMTVREETYYVLRARSPEGRHLGIVCCLLVANVRIAAVFPLGSA